MTMQPTSLSQDAPDPHIGFDIHRFAYQWRGRRQGQRTFNQQVHEELRRANLDRSLVCDDEGDFWNQTVLAFLVNPRTPIHRLLVVWQLGTGKTLGMLRILENFFDDPRPRVLVFPTAELVGNFYQELLTHPNRYREWLRERRGIVGPGKNGSPEAWGAVVARAQHDLELHPQHTGLAAPLRAFSYTWAGGKTLVNHWPGFRCGPAAHVARRRSHTTLALSHCIVLCDEAHNLNRPQPHPLVHACRDRVFHAEGSVVVLFTATPVLRGPESEAQAMLELTRGHAHRHDESDEGYVSWFMERPRELFARARPGLARLPRIVRVPIDGTAYREMPGDDEPGSGSRPLRWPKPPAQDTLFRDYVKRRFTGAKRRRRSQSQGGGDEWVIPPTQNARCIRSTSAAPAPAPTGKRCAPTTASFEHLAFWWHHETKHCKDIGDSVERARVLSPKLTALAESIHVDAPPRKTVVLIHRESGLRTLVHILEHVFGFKPVWSPAPLTSSMTAKQRRAALAANRAAVERFNQAPRGAFVAPAEDFSEGVSFRRVRRIVLADLSPGLEPPSWTMVKQRVGRALRACSHHDLPPAERDLQVDLYVAVHQQRGLPPTVDQEKLELLHADMQSVEAGMRYLKARSVDALYYADPTPTPTSSKLAQIRHLQWADDPNPKHHPQCGVM